LQATLLFDEVYPILAFFLGQEVAQGPNEPVVEGKNWFIGQLRQRRLVRRKKNRRE
jgi:hypothetical protein